MLICSREQGNSLIKDTRNLLSSDERNKDHIDYEVKEIKHGRGAGVENLTPEMRNLIAEEALLSGKTQKEVAKEYGVSPQAVEAYVNGATSLATYNERSENLAAHVEGVKEQIKTQAQNALLTAIQSLTESKISGAKARDIAGIAKDMSAVIRNINPADGTVVNNNNKVLIYSPRVKEEDDYKVIEARE